MSHGGMVSDTKPPVRPECIRVAKRIQRTVQNGCLAAKRDTASRQQHTPFSTSSHTFMASSEKLLIASPALLAIAAAFFLASSGSAIFDSEPAQSASRGESAPQLAGNQAYGLFLSWFSNSVSVLHMKRSRNLRV